MTQIRVVPVDVVELVGPGGTLGLFQVESKWEGLMKLVSLKPRTGGLTGETIIVAQPVQSAFERLFAERSEAEVPVWSASPVLLEKLAAKAEPAS